MLSEEEAIDLALSSVVGFSTQWADGAFLGIDDARGRFSADQDAAFHEWGHGFAGQLCADLAAEAEWIAGSIGASRDQTSRFIAACAGIFLARLDQLLSTPMQRGCA